MNLFGFWIYINWEELNGSTSAPHFTLIQLQQLQSTHTYIPHTTISSCMYLCTDILELEGTRLSLRLPINQLAFSLSPFLLFFFLPFNPNGYKEMQVMAPFPPRPLLITCDMKWRERKRGSSYIAPGFIHSRVKSTSDSYWQSHYLTVKGELKLEDSPLPKSNPLNLWI